MTNSEINKKIKLAAQLMELHGENPFKVRSYHSGREIVSSLSFELSTIDPGEVNQVDGIGKSLAIHINQLLDRGSFDKLDDLLGVTPEGVVEMLKIPGFGPKKINVLWKNAGAESLEQVLDLCKAGQIASLKGFGEKTQESLIKAVMFLIGCRGKEKYADVEVVIDEFADSLKGLSSIEFVSTISDTRRKVEVLDSINFLVGTNDFSKSRTYISNIEGVEVDEKRSGPLTCYLNYEGCTLPIIVRFSSVATFYIDLIENTGSPLHTSWLKKNAGLHELDRSIAYSSEKDVFQTLNIDFIEPEMREGGSEIEKAKSGSLPQLIEMNDLRGILHNHSTYSDGKHTLRQMAEHCKALGYEYLGISDHSQTAVYANGLFEHKVKEQQEEIRSLNKELAPFKIFSGIESDILADGSLDYSDEVLASFDFVVSSIHSGLSMDKSKATNRLLAAIHNPYTTILGHMTGRLILEREGYPVDHMAVIDACAEAGVVIEINASPYRLDIDWRWVEYALDKKVMLSINPDAHKMEGYGDMKYGVYAGRKGGLTREMTLNAMDREEITRFFDSRKKR